MQSVKCALFSDCSSSSFSPLSYAYSNSNGNGSNGSNNSNQVPPTRYRFDYHHDKQQHQQEQPLSPMNIASDLSYEGASAGKGAAERPLPYYGADSRGGHNNNYSAYDGGGGNGYLDYLGKR